MSRRSVTIASLSSLAALALVVACNVDSTAPSGNAGLRVINAWQSPVDVIVDGRVVMSGLAVSGISPKVGIAPGSHDVRLQSSSGIAADVAVTAVDGATTTTYGYASSGLLDVAELPDTGAIVPAGHTKLRVVHLAASAPPLDVWRTQPDYQTPIRVMFPFPYLAASPYLQSTVGSWEVFVTALHGDSTLKLATTGAVAIPDGQRRTAVLMDSAGTMVFRVLDN